MMCGFRFILIGFAVFYGTVMAVEYDDSLRIVINNTTSDSKKLNALTQLSFHYLYTYPDSVEKYAQKMVELSNHKDSVKYKYYGYKWKALAEYTRGHLKEATGYYLKAAGLCEQLHDEDELNQCKTNLGVLYHKQGYFYLALNYYLEAINIIEKNNIINGNVYNNVAEIYFEQGEYEKAMPYHEKSLEIYTAQNDKQGMAYSYNFKGDLYFKDGNYKEAIGKYKQALKLYQSIDDIQGTAIQFNKLGLSYYKLGQLKTAQKYYVSTIKNFGDDVDLKEKAIAVNSLGRIYADRNELNKAIDYSKQSLDLAQQVNSKSEIQSAYESLYRYYEKMNNPAKALEYFILFSQLQDSIMNEKYSRQIQELGIQYETEKKEKELISLSQKNKLQQLKITRNKRIVYATTGSLLFIIIISVLYIRQNRLKNKQKAMELEQRLLRTQMNPHFIFNSLIAIQNYVLKNQSVKAGEYLSDFAALMRSILSNSNKEFVSMESELEFLENYFSLQQLRFSQSFDYTINSDPNIDLEATGIPPMLAQPFIENSIEHGFKSIKHRGIIDVKFHIKNESIIFELSDNGVGREEAGKQEQKNHESFALEITEKRIKNINKNRSKGYSFKIEDLKSASGEISGTKVTFRIPLVYI